MNKLPNLETLDLLFRAEFESGQLWWRDSPLKPRRAIAGAPAGNIDPHRHGRCVVQIFGKKHGRYRILWAMHHRRDPYPNVIDHIDRNPANDAIHNLRAVPQHENMANQDFAARAGQLPVGVRFSARAGRRKRYSARIDIAGRSISLGYYMTPEEAHQAYLRAASNRRELYRLKTGQQP